MVTDNLCHHNHNSGIQVVNSSHVLVQANACYQNTNGIGLFSREDLKDPGRHVIGVNMLYDNDQDLRQGDFQTTLRCPGRSGWCPSLGARRRRYGCLPPVPLMIWGVLPPVSSGAPDR